MIANRKVAPVAGRPLFRFPETGRAYYTSPVYSGPRKSPSVKTLARKRRSGKVYTGHNMEMDPAVLGIVQGTFGPVPC